jgi:hypothetical protein
MERKRYRYFLIICTSSESKDALWQAGDTVGLKLEENWKDIFLRK